MPEQTPDPTMAVLTDIATENLNLRLALARAGARIQELEAEQTDKAPTEGE